MQKERSAQSAEREPLSRPASTLSVRPPRAPVAWRRGRGSQRRAGGLARRRRRLELSPLLAPLPEVVLDRVDLAPDEFSEPRLFDLLDAAGDPDLKAAPREPERGNGGSATASRWCGGAHWRGHLIFQKSTAVAFVCARKRGREVNKRGSCGVLALSCSFA